MQNNHYFNKRNIIQEQEIIENVESRNIIVLLPGCPGYLTILTKCIGDSNTDTITQMYRHRYRYFDTDTFLCKKCISTSCIFFLTALRKCIFQLFHCSTLEPHYNTHFGVHSDISVITEQPYNEGLIRRKYKY